jgi:DNA-directed RNA polymerase specialized sigma subunit
VPSTQETIPHFDIEQIRSFRPILSFLNEKDRDILFLIFVSSKKQKDVQRIIERSQPSLCYDIKRIRMRLKFIFYLHSVFDIFEDFVCRRGIEYFTSEEREILTLMFYTSSFTLTAKIMGISQVRVRYAYDKCLRRLEYLKMWEVYEIFVILRANLNMVKRVYIDPDKNEGPLGDLFVPA